MRGGRECGTAISLHPALGRRLVESILRDGEQGDDDEELRTRAAAFSSAVKMRGWRSRISAELAELVATDRCVTLPLCAVGEERSWARQFELGGHVGVHEPRYGSG